jgi:hypothetical protein
VWFIIALFGVSHEWMVQLLPFCSNPLAPQFQFKCSSKKRSAKSAITSQITSTSSQSKSVTENGISAGATLYNPIVIMVEFGLKLEDNKVSDWAEHYINYEKLKTTLTKLKAAIKKKEELFKRKPDLAKDIELAYEAHMYEGDTDAILSQRLGFNSSSNIGDESKAEEAATDLVDKVPEQQALLQRSAVAIKEYGSNNTLASGEAIATDSGVGGGIRRTLSGTFSGVSGYLANSRYENKLQEHLKAIDGLRAQFHEQLIFEVQKVNTFYLKESEELSKRLGLLIESVEESDTIDAAELRSIKQKKRKSRKSVAQLVVSQIKNIVSTDPFHEAPLTPIQETHKARFLDTEDRETDELDDQRIVTEVREADSIQRALGDQYRTIKLLHNFSIMNYTGFVKIAKKFDKTCPRFKGMYKEAIKEANICNEGKEVEALEERVEKAYASWFCDDNLREARAQLLPKKGDGLQMDWSQLRLGYRLGMCAILTLWVCWDCVWGLVRDGHSTIGGRNAFPVFRACGGLLLLHWFWGASVYVWTRNRVNYIFLFDLQPDTVNSPLSIFNDAVDETLVFLVLMLLYYKAGANDIPNVIPAGYFPAILVLYTVGCLMFPMKTRFPMWRSIFEVVTAPLTSPTFFTIYIADVFTSMVKVFQDVAWTIGFIVSLDFLKSEDDLDTRMHHEWQHSFWYKNVLIPLICLFPLWTRFNQCLRRYADTGKRMPNLANALKYAMSQTVTLFGAFHPLYLNYKRVEEGEINWFQVGWMLLFVSSSLYSFWWDVYMDWGLGSLKHGFLSDRLMYQQRYYYYCVIALDIVLRFMWVLTLVPPQSGASFEVPQYLTAVTMSLELMRRTMWGFFRLEHEQRANTNQYRRVSFVPLHFNTGHKHKYNQGREHVGWRVLLEVATVTLVVIGISVASVVAAQRATQHDYTDSDL